MEPEERQRNVLIADDTTDTRDLYAEYFGARGFSVVTAHDGARAVHAALEGDAHTQPSQVILLTGYPHKAVERGALEACADLFLTKPCLPEVLERYVNRLRRPRRSV